MIRMGVSGYRPTRVVPDQRPLNGRCCYSYGLNCIQHQMNYEQFCLDDICCFIKIFDLSKLYKFTVTIVLHCLNCLIPQKVNTII